MQNIIRPTRFYQIAWSEPRKVGCVQRVGVAIAPRRTRRPRFGFPASIRVVFPLVHRRLYASRAVPWLSGRASRSHREGRWFDPSRDHKKVATRWVVSTPSCVPDWVFRYRRHLRLDHCAFCACLQAWYFSGRHIAHGRKPAAIAVASSAKNTRLFTYPPRAIVRSAQVQSNSP